MNHSLKRKLAVLILSTFTCSFAMGAATVVTPAADGSYISADGTQELMALNQARAVIVTPAAAATTGASARVVSTGGLVTHPGAGAGGADESTLQDASLGMSLLGAGVQASLPARLAEDFVLSGTENINTITVYAYQTGAATAPSTITAANLRIWDGVPDAVGSNVVFGDTVTNRLASSSWSNVYRVTESTGGNTNRPVMANVITVGVTLPAGTYWLDWQLTGSGAFSGPWAPPITISGQTVTGNALQFFAGGFTPSLDNSTGTQQGYPIEMDLDAISVPVFTPLGLIMMVSGLIWFGRRRKLKLG